MEPQEGRRISPFRVTKRSTKLRRLSKTTRSRVHIQTVGLNARQKTGRHRADGEECLWTFFFIGLFRFRELPSQWQLRGRRVFWNTQILQTLNRISNETKPSVPSLPVNRG